MGEEREPAKQPRKDPVRAPSKAVGARVPPMLMLQRSIGNRAVNDLLAEQHQQSGAAPVLRRLTEPDRPLGAKGTKKLVPLPPPKEQGKLDDPKAEARLQALSLDKAKEVIAKVEPLERWLSNELKAIAANFQGQMVGLTHATKEVDSLHRKLADLARERVQAGEVMSHAIEMEAANTKDALRYTMTLPSDQYAEIADTKLVEALKKVNAERIKAGNSWAPPSEAGTPHSYKGFNSAYTITTAEGLTFKFEVQLHTPESWAMKSKLHKLYETARSSKTSPEDKADANQKMADAWTNVTVPKGMDEYDKDMKKKQAK